VPQRRLIPLAILVATPAVLAQQGPPPQVPGAIRSRVVLVPVDVRVIDRDGNPVTDLRQSDFAIEENGVAQTIAHFSTQTYTAQPPGAATVPPLRRGPGLEDTPPTHRTFVILLGRGRLQGPSKGLDAVIDFVRTDLLPQDRVAVLAYGRAHTHRGGWGLPATRIRRRRDGVGVRRRESAEPVAGECHGEGRSGDDCVYGGRRPARGVDRHRSVRRRSKPETGG